MTIRDWNDDECSYLAELVKRGHDTPRVGPDQVETYLQQAHAAARRDRRQDVREFITLLGMYRVNRALATWLVIEDQLSASETPAPIPLAPQGRNQVAAG